MCSSWFSRSMCWGMLFVAACSGRNGKCDTRRASAMDSIQRVIDANNTCASDTDCVVVEFQSGCFDACTRSVNRAGKSAVAAAIANVDQSDCSTYVSDGCTRDVPPCAPPTSPKCVSGQCAQ
jgi:hypothetical protein